MPSRALNMPQKKRNPEWNKFVVLFESAEKNWWVVKSKASLQWIKKQLSLKIYLINPHFYKVEKEMCRC